MSIGAIRRILYRVAAILGHVNAVSMAVKKRSAKPIVNRVIRTFMWRGWGSFAARIFKGL